MKTQTMKKNGEILNLDCRVATGFFSRFLGLMGRKSIAAREALIFPKCNSIHTFFMRFPIDVVMVDGQGAVIDVIPCLSPWRLLLPRRQASHVIELRANRSQELGIVPGVCLELQGVWS